MVTPGHVVDLPAHRSPSGDRPRRWNRLGKPLPMWARWLIVVYAAAALVSDLLPQHIAQPNAANQHYPVSLLLVGACATAAVAIRPRLGAMIAIGVMLLNPLGLPPTNSPDALNFAMDTGLVVTAALLAAPRMTDLWVWLGVCGLWAPFLVFQRPADPIRTALIMAPAGLGLLLVVGVGLPVRHITLRSREARARAEALVERHATSREKEHAALARELHDVVAHRLALASLALASATSQDGADGRDAIDEASQLLQLAGRELSGLVQGLRSSDELTAPLASFSASWQRTVHDSRTILEAAGFHLEVRQTGDEPRDVPPLIVETVARCLRETSTNVTRYAPSGSTCEVDLEFTGDRIGLTVTSPLSTTAQKANPGTGWGLIGLAERADLLGGRCVFEPVGDNWVVSLVLPCPPAASALSIATGRRAADTRTPPTTSITPVDIVDAPGRPAS